MPASFFTKQGELICYYKIKNAVFIKSNTLYDRYAITLQLDCHKPTSKMKLIQY